ADEREFNFAVRQQPEFFAHFDRDGHLSLDSHPHGNTPIGITLPWRAGKARPTADVAPFQGREILANATRRRSSSASYVAGGIDARRRFKSSICDSISRCRGDSADPAMPSGAG